MATGVSNHRGCQPSCNCTGQHSAATYEELENPSHLPVLDEGLGVQDKPLSTWTGHEGTAQTMQTNEGLDEADQNSNVYTGQLLFTNEGPSYTGRDEGGKSLMMETELDLKGQDQALNICTGRGLNSDERSGDEGQFPSKSEGNRCQHQSTAQKKVHEDAVPHRSASAGLDDAGLTPKTTPFQHLPERTSDKDTDQQSEASIDFSVKNDHPVTVEVPLTSKWRTEVTSQMEEDDLGQSSRRRGGNECASETMIIGSGIEDPGRISDSNSGSENMGQNTGLALTASPISQTGRGSKEEYSQEDQKVVESIMTAQDFYALLRVERDVKGADLKRAYRRLALAVHPDKNKAPGAEQAFKIVGDAFATLDHPKKRQEYDAILASRTDGLELTSATDWVYPSCFQAELSPKELLDFTEGYLPDSIIYMLSNELGAEWRELGYCLGIPHPIMEKFTGSRAGRECPLLMLHCWRQSCPSDVDAKASLIKALKLIGQGHLAAKVERNPGPIEKILLEIYPDLHGDWERLASSLGMDSSEIQAIKPQERNQNCVSNAIVEMLIWWRNDRGRQSAQGILKPLASCRRQDIVAKLGDRYNLVPLKSSPDPLNSIQTPAPLLCLPQYGHNEHTQAAVAKGETPSPDSSVSGGHSNLQYGFSDIRQSHSLQGLSGRTQLDEIQMLELQLQQLKEKRTLWYAGECIKQVVRKHGHVINRDSDKKIDFDLQFITLRMVASSDFYSMLRTNDYLPDKYQHFIQRMDSTNILLNDLLDMMRISRSLLIQGRAGIGKSTLVQKMVHLWSLNGWAQEYDAVFLFNIRSLTVIDKRKITLVEMLKFFTVYSFWKEDSNLEINSIVKNMQKVIVIFDGVDEFSNFKSSVENIKVLDLNEEAEPLEWCVNLLRRDILKTAVLILSTRPFNDLRLLDCGCVIEVVGLTREGINEFINVHVGAENVERVRNSMTSNPLVMSVSAITYFCLMFCTVLEADESLTTQDLTTYSRIAAFFIKNYMSRCRPGPSGDASLCLPPLARLAYRGLVDNRDHDNLARLVFHQADMEQAGLVDFIRKLSEECGILVSSMVRSSLSDDEDRLTSEFVHLSVQEFLSMAELLTREKKTVMEVYSVMQESGGFNMAKVYFFGLCFDMESQHIQELREAVSDGPVVIQQLLSTDLVDPIFGKNMPSMRNPVLQTIQVCYETQRRDLAKSMAPKEILESKEICLQSTLLTAIDMKATFFMIHNIPEINALRLNRVTMDTTCQSIMVEELGQSQQLTTVILSSTECSAANMIQLLQTLPTTAVTELRFSECDGFEQVEQELMTALAEVSGLRVLGVSDNKFSSVGVQLLMSAAKAMTDLKELHLNELGIDDDTVKHILQALPHMSLGSLRLTNNRITDVRELVSKLTTVASLHTVSLEGMKRTREDIEAVMNTLKTNNTLESLWMTDTGGNTRVLVSVGDTGRRFMVERGFSSTTRIYAWSMQDITTISTLHDQYKLPSSNYDLYIWLNEQFRKLYGDGVPEVTAQHWADLLHALGNSRFLSLSHLYISLSSSDSLYPLLSTLTYELLRTFALARVRRIEVNYGTVRVTDFLDWLYKLRSQPGFVEHKTNDIKIKFHDGASALVRFGETKVLTDLQQYQENKVILEEMLCSPEWVIT